MAGLIPVRKAAACAPDRPYQFSCIHRMASSSLNCLSNSYSCRASTDMLAEDGGGRVPFALLGQDDGGGWGGGRGGWGCLFSRFPRGFELASLGSLSDPVGCARTARQWRNRHPPPAAPTPSSPDGGDLGPNAGRVTATLLYHLESTEVIKQGGRKYQCNLFICSFNVCDVIVPIFWLKGIMECGQGEDKHLRRPLLGDFSMTSSSPSPIKGRFDKPYKNKILNLQKPCTNQKILNKNNLCPHTWLSDLGFYPAFWFLSLNL